MQKKAKLSSTPLLRNESGRLGAAPWPPPGPPRFKANGHLDLWKDTYGVQAQMCESSKRMQNGVKRKRSKPSHPRHPPSLGRPSGSCRDLLGHLLDRPDALHLLIAQDDLPDGIRHGPKIVAGAEPHAVVHLAHQLKALGGRAGLHPLVELHAFLDPLVVERLWWLIQHQLEGG